MNGSGLLRSMERFIDRCLAAEFRIKRDKHYNLFSKLLRKLDCSLNINHFGERYRCDGIGKVLNEGESMPNNRTFIKRKKKQIEAVEHNTI